MGIVLVHRGYPVAEATAATVTKSIYMVMWVILFGLVGLRAASDGRVPAVIDDHLALWLATPTAIVALLVTVVATPGPIIGGAHAGSRDRICRAGGARVVETLGNCRPLSQIGRSTRGMPASRTSCVMFVVVYIAIRHVI